MDLPFERNHPDPLVGRVIIGRVEGPSARVNLPARARWRQSSPLLSHLLCSGPFGPVVGRLSPDNVVRKKESARPGSAETVVVRLRSARCGLDQGGFPWRFPSMSSAHWRSEEHTSELQSRQYLVCRLLLEKKKKTK